MVVVYALVYLFIGFLVMAMHRHYDVKDAEDVGKDDALYDGLGIVFWPVLAAVAVLFLSACLVGRTIEWLGKLLHWLVG